MGLKSDKWIKEMAEGGMISPFEPAQLSPCPLCGQPALLPFNVGGNDYTHCSNEKCDLLLHCIRDAWADLIERKEIGNVDQRVD